MLGICWAVSPCGDHSQLQGRGLGFLFNQGLGFGFNTHPDHPAAARGRPDAKTRICTAILVLNVVTLL